MSRDGMPLPDGGFVLCYLGKAFGWTRDLGEANRFVPGTIAVPAADGRLGFWQADGGDAQNGAERWHRLQ